MGAGPQLPEPVAQGDLSKTPFAHLLLYIHNKQLTGSLVLWHVAQGRKPRQDRICFRDGVPVAGRLVKPASRLDRSLLPIFTLTEGPFAFYEGVDLVGVKESPSLRRGRVQPLALLAASMRGSVRDDVVSAVLGRYDGRPVRLVPGFDLDGFELLPNERSFVELVRAEPAPVTQLAESSELPARMAERLLYLLTITKALTVFDGETSSPPGPRDSGTAHAMPSSPPPIHTPVPLDAPSHDAGPSLPMPPEPDDEAPTGRISVPDFGDSPTGRTPLTDGDDLPLPDLGGPSLPAPPPPATSSPPSRQSNPRATGAPPGDAPRLSLPPESLPPEPVPAPPPDLSDEHAQYWQEVRDRFASLDRQNYFQMLGIPVGASVEAARAAYLKLVKQWHPDRVPNELADVVPFVEKIFTLLTEARETLTDTTRRADYIAQVEGGGGTPASERELNRIVQAAMEFRKVEVLMRRREWDRAGSLLEQTLLLNDEEPDYHAAQAWVLFQLNGTDPKVRSRILATLQRALELNDSHDRAHFYLGTYLKQIGEEDRALEHFERAAKINPKNIDAQREVRLAAMRSRGGRRPSRAASKRPSDKPAGGGLLSRWFGGSGNDGKKR